MNNTNPKVDTYLSKAKQWKSEISILRDIMLSHELIEDLKWGAPCYTFQQTNVVIMHGFKQYCAVTFFKGALINDIENVLVQPGENTQSSRQIRFETVDDITRLTPLLNDYIQQAIEIERAGLKVDFKPVEQPSIPDELAESFKMRPELEASFNALTPGRQRAYLIHFNDAKQSKTRQNRIDKYTSRILNGKGMNDCVCGLSKKMPNCDGSHKGFSV